MALLFAPVEDVLAQDGTIAGVVVDGTSEETIPGVNVVVLGLGIGAATDVDGQFEIDGVPEGAYVLKASYIGYTPKQTDVTVTAGETTDVRIELAPSEVQLENVVVTALGIERERRALGYSVGEVDGADLQQAGETNFIGMLAGKTAGAQISTSTQMGGSSRIVLRGASSISGDNQPLIVVDGVPLDNSNFNSTNQSTGSGGYDYGNAASIINPSDIKSISILKGASAAALYGSRAANGVIEITTKSGEGEQGIGVTFQTELTASDLYGFPDYQNKYGGGANPNFDENSQGQLAADFGTDQSWGPRLDGRQVREWFSYDEVNGFQGQTTPWDAHPDNVENFYNTGLVSKSDLSFSQGGETYNYRLSVSNIYNEGTAPESDLERQTFGFNGSINLTDKLRASASGNFINEEAEGRPGSGYTNASGPWLQFNHFGQRQIDLSDGSPMRDIARPDGTQRSWNWSNNATAPLAGDIIYANNPFWLRERNFQDDDTQRIFGKVALSYAFTDELSVSTNIRTDYYTERRSERIAIGSVEQPEYSESVREVQETNVGGQVEYSGDLAEMVSLQATGGVNYRYNDFNLNGGTTAGGLATDNLFTLENSISRPIIDDFFEEQALVGVYGDVTVGYDDMVYVGGSLRNDWSSTLPADDNSYLYPSVNASFVFSSLPALEDNSILSFGKLRASWSQVGRDTNPYQLSFDYPLGTPYGSRQVQSLPGSLPNENLERELKSSWEVGLQMDFLNNRVGVDATYYDSETSDLIQRVATSRASGFSSRVLNAGTISNKGVELTLTATPILTEDFSWDVQLNWSKNVNEVESLAEGIENLPINRFDTSPPFGPEIVARVGEEFGTFWGNGFVRDENGNKVLGENGFYEQEGPKVLGSYQPDWTWSAATTLTYNSVTANVLVDGQKGGDIWSLSNLFGLYSGMFEETARDNIRELGMQPEGVLADGTPFQGESLGPAKNVFQTLFGNHEAHIYDASFIKLREVTVSYDLPGRWFGSAPLQGLQVAAIGRNLATLLKYTPNFDPTAVTRSSGNLQGIEAGQLPPKRTYGLRIRASF